jgi:transposase
LYLPSYSPDYNPIEEAFAKLKHLLRQTKEALVEAIAAALSAISARDVRGLLDHAGYRTMAHLL